MFPAVAALLLLTVALVVRGRRHLSPTMPTWPFLLRSRWRAWQDVRMSPRRHRTGESATTVVVALAANLGIAIAKLAAAIISGSSAMLAESFHAMADTGNEVLLLIAQRKSERP